MERHPIPQQISSYEFKLVGEMTLKQFAKAAGGIILALIFNASPLIFFVKWPLIFISAVGGLLLAFVPYQDRPLEKWIVGFLKSIYSPTMYVYRKKRAKNWLDIDMSKNILAEKEEENEERENMPVKQEEKVAEFIESLPSVKKEKKVKEEEAETKPPAPAMTKAEEPKAASVPAEAEDSGVPKDDWSEGKPGLKLKKEKLEATGDALFGKIPMPGIPELPNLVVGMVTNSAGGIVEGAIVEIQDKEGNPNRVLKTNQLGQFKTQTQLSDGDYLLVTEKEGFEFDRVKIILTGKIVQPVKIIAK
jgi:hypothetical protein